MESRRAIDSNVLIYLHQGDEYPLRMQRARELIDEHCPVVSALVIAEYLHAREKLYRRTHRGMIDPWYGIAM
jgi:predicted nucleic acid-binding protein